MLRRTADERGSLLLVWMSAGVTYGVAEARAAPRSGSHGSECTSACGRSLHKHALRGQAAHWLADAVEPSRPCRFSDRAHRGRNLVDLVARRSGGRLTDSEEFVRFISTANGRERSSHRSLDLCESSPVRSLTAIHRTSMQPLTRIGGPEDRALLRAGAAARLLAPRGHSSL